MQKPHKPYRLLGFVLGLLCAGLAVNTSCPQFFTAEHLELLHASIVSE